MVYCHGLCSNRTMHSGTAKDLASHGFIVFMLDHKDGTSSYVYDKDGSNPRMYNNSAIAYDFEIRKPQIKIREKEVMALIDEIFDE